MKSLTEISKFIEANIDSETLKPKNGYSCNTLFGAIAHDRGTIDRELCSYIREHHDGTFRNGFGSLYDIFLDGAKAKTPSLKKADLAKALAEKEAQLAKLEALLASKGTRKPRAKAKA